MDRRKYGACLAVLVLLIPCALSADYYQHQQQYGYNQGGGGGAARAVPLEQVKILTLYNGRKTTGRRHAGVPQLNCISGCEFEPDVVQCQNMGSDGSSVQWKCEADLPSNLRFGTTTVTCEGYDYPDDPRILEGSCGLEYSLRRVKGEGGKQSSRSTGYDDYSQSWSWGQLFKWGVIIYIVYMAFQVFAAQGNAAPRRPGRTDGWGWGGWGGGGGGPPPPQPPPPPSYYDGKMGYGSTGASTGANPWVTGAAGLGLGYLMGRRGNNTGSANWGNRPSYGSPSPSSWYGGGGGSGRSSSDGSGPSRTATAYASTSRR